ncbi:hypothetical protein [Gloeobacter violaceus]|uniref:hypothetical protein n=1 Tax=Gloeobacter violaceus TaxID=33072 RepID=UPI0013E8DC0B|nr:hypothetical protein [Gloeobacter violaceus]
MVRGVRDDALRREVIRLRVEKRMSLRQISDVTGAAKGSLSAWLKDYPLTPSEIKERQSRAHYVPPKKDRGELSKHWTDKVAEYTRAQKGRIAESAILFRLHLHRFDVYKAPDDRDKTVWLVRVPATGKIFRIEVRWTRINKKGGLPSISLHCRAGVGKYRRYADDEFDFIVGYNLYSDTAYVFSSKEISHLSSMVAIRSEAAERWDKLFQR